MDWSVFAASARGSSHQAADAPCQDASASALHGEWVVAVVCDGAGSAKLSHVGSRTIAQITTQALVARGDELASATGDRVHQLITDALLQARQSLTEQAGAAGTKLSAYAATVVGAVIGPSHGWFFHIGDGVAVAQHGDDVSVSLPENGEYANETFFLTGTEWRNHLRVSRVDKPSHAVLLMSDGAMPFVMDKGSRTLFQPFAEPVLRFLSSADEAAGTQALLATLDDPRTHRITCDDKTLLIALRR